MLQKAKRTVQLHCAQLGIKMPWDRNSSLEPQLVKKRQHRLVDFDDKVLSQYTQQLSNRAIQSRLKELYGVEV